MSSTNTTKTAITFSINLTTTTTKTTKIITPTKQTK
jgi:hypothetical protein